MADEIDREIDGWEFVPDNNKSRIENMMAGIVLLEMKRLTKEYNYRLKNNIDVSKWWFRRLLNKLGEKMDKEGSYS